MGTGEVGDLIERSKSRRLLVLRPDTRLLTPGLLLRIRLLFLPFRDGGRTPT